MAGRNVLLGSASLVLLNVCMVWGQQDPLPLKMEDFTTEPADWVGLRNRDAGLETDYGFSETNNAGGSAGEIGGRLPERNNAAASYYADLSVGGAFELSQQNELEASGKFTINKNAPDGGFFVGWLDANNPEGNFDIFGLNVNFCQGCNFPAGQTWWRPFAIIDGTLSGPGPVLTPETLLTPNVLYEFKISHDPDGAGPTAGLLNVELTNADTGELLDSRLARIPGPDIGPTALLNAFGVRTNFSTRDAPGSFAEVYFDDFEYSISGLPESDFQPGDANEDFSVDTQDIIQILAENKFETGDPATFAQGDFNGDGVFNTADVIEMLGVGLFETGPYFEPAVSAESVPEPASIVTLILGMLSLAVCGWRRRSRNYSAS